MIEPCDVLVVDDDPDVREALATALELDELAVRSAANGVDALAALRQGLRPRVILLDLMMPDMNGWQFRAAQLADPSIAAIPVVVLSAGNSIGAVARQMGVAGILRKPVEYEDLLRVLERFRAPRPSAPA